MTRETYAERKERERQRDAIRDLAFEVASHVAGGDMTTVERVERDGYPAVQFGRPLEGWRCKCGMEMVPLPTFSKRWGVMACWFCVVCDLPEVVAACERVRAEVAPTTSLKPRSRIAA